MTQCCAAVFISKAFCKRELTKPCQTPSFANWIEGASEEHGCSSAQRCNFIFNRISIWEEVERQRMLLFSRCRDFTPISKMHSPCLRVQKNNSILGSGNKLPSKHGNFWAPEEGTKGDI